MLRRPALMRTHQEDREGLVQLVEVKVLIHGLGHELEHDRVMPPA